MTFKHIFQHALRMAKREFSSGEYRLTIFALIIGVTAVMSLSLTTSRIQKTMFSQAADLIGGDLVVTSTDWSDKLLEENAISSGLDYSLSVSFPTMVGSKDQFLLSSLRAVDNHYPLKGRLLIKQNINGKSVDTDLRPEPGTTWVEKRLLDRLNVNPGDIIEIGNVSLKIAKVLVIEPDRGGGFYSFYPRLLINRVDLEQSKLVQSASRVSYKLMLAGEAQSLADWMAQSVPLLKANQRLLDPQSGKTRISTNLERASVFINLSALMSVILCGIAVSLAASRHARRHINQVALLRCFGLRASDVNSIYALQLLLIALPAIVIGMVCGYLIHLGLIRLLAEFFATQLPGAAIKAWLSGPLTALSMVLGFGLPSVLQLAKTPPARVLRRELKATHRAPFFSGFLALISLTTIAWWQTADLLLAILSVSGSIIIIVVLLGFVILLLKLLSRKFIKHPMMQAAYANLSARPVLTAMQIAGFGLSTFTIALILLFRSDLFMQWNKEIPHNAPNRFVFDIFKNDKPQLEALLKTENITTTIYPIVRGRLIKINNNVVQQAVSKHKQQSRQHNHALERDLALTQITGLPKDNTIVEGEFFNDSRQLNPEMNPVSVEAELAENLNLNLNDKLEFLIEGQSLIATITSFRSVNWENFNPNFYMIFPQGVLDNFSQSWLTSFYLEPGKSELDNLINKKLTSVTMIDVDFVLKRIRRIIDQISSAMELIFSMTVFAGISVFWAALLITFDEKQKQAALLRALGASRANVSQRFICEQIIIGLFAGLLSALSLAIVSWLISSRLLNIDWNFPIAYCLGLPILLISGLSALATIQLKKILRTPPYKILQTANLE